jgi:hypothetical protein
MLKKPICIYNGEFKELQSSDQLSGYENLSNDAQLKRGAGDINSFTEKSVPVNNDLLLIEDSEDSYTKKKVKKSSLGGSGTKIVCKSTVETITSNNTYHSDGSLSLSVEANAVYQYELLLMVNHAGGSTAGFKAQFTAPSGATAYSHVFRNANNNSSFYLVYQANTLILNNENGVITGTGDYNLLKANGLIISGSAPGILTVQWAQYTSSAINTSVMAGSYLLLNRIN